MGKTFRYGDEVYRHKPRPKRDPGRLRVIGDARDGKVKVLELDSNNRGVYEFPEEDLHFVDDNGFAVDGPTGVD